MKNTKQPLPPSEKRSQDGRLNATIAPAVKRQAMAVCGDNLSRYVEAALVEKMARDRRRRAVA